MSNVPGNDGSGSGVSNAGSVSNGIPTPGQLESDNAGNQGTGSVPAKTAPTLEQVKAARRAKLLGQDQGGTGSGAGQAQSNSQGGNSQDGSANGTGKGNEQVPGSDKGQGLDPALATFTGLRRDLQNVQKQLQDLTPIAEQGRKFAQAQELIKQGKHYEAIQILGADFNAAVSQVMEIEDPENKAKSELEQIKAEQERIRKELDDERKAEADANAAAEREEGRKHIRTFVKNDAKTFPLLSKSDAWIDAALDEADKAYPKAIAALKEQGEDRDLTIEEKNQLIYQALKGGEAFRVKERELYGIGFDPGRNNPNRDSRPAQTPTITSDLRGTISAPRVQGPGKMTIEQAKQRRREQTQTR